MVSNASKGLSLIELMVALSIMSVGMLGFIGAFSFLSKSISNARARTIASNLAQEEQESLKKISYYRLVVTTAPVYASETGAGSFPYDSTYYPSETVVVAGSPFTRRVYVEKVQEGSDGFESVDPAQPDTGMKKITVYVMWRLGTGKYQVQEVRSLYSNPSRQALGSTIKGNVTRSGGGVLSDVRVECLQNTSFFDESDSVGDYTFKVTAGTYTLRASKSGYYTTYSTDIYVAASSTGTKNIVMSQIGSGLVHGRVWLNDHLVISRVVGSTVNVTMSQEYVEVFNPTTFTWTMTDVGLNYQRPADGARRTILIDYHNASIAPGGFFLFANTSPVVSGDASVDADAEWSDSNNPGEFPYFTTQRNILATTDLPAQGAGALELYRISDARTLDIVGWDKNGLGQSAPFMEADGIDQPAGLDPNESYVRLSSTMGYSTTYGPAYDSGNNTVDFQVNSPITNPARNSSTAAQTVISGTPAVGAVVSANDGLSSPATAQLYLGGSNRPYAEFRLPSVATGTYVVEVASGTNYLVISTVAITANATTYVPNAVTDPVWGVAGYHNVLLSSSSMNGYVSGKVKNIFSSPLSGKKVEAGGTVATTGSDGSYIMAVTEGVYNVNANPESVAGYDSQYVSLSSSSVEVYAGQVNNGVDFLLSQGGGIVGFVTTNGTDALPNVVVIAKKDGIERGSALSAANGRFDISNLSTGTYTVEPQLDRGETVSPSSPTAAVTLGADVFAATFTVTGAFGTITGNLADNSKLITTGVLIVATTGTISTDPPTDNSSLRSGTLLYYSGSSHADGTYRLEVRGSASGTTYNVYAWYTKWSGTTPTTVRKDDTATVTAGGTVSKNFTWP